MITIFNLVTDTDIGGAERVLANVVRATDASRFRQVVVSMTGFGPVAHQLREAGIEVHTLGMRRGVPNLGGFWRLVKLLRRSKPDLLLCWMYHANLLGLLAGKLAGAPHIIWSTHAANPRLSAYRSLTRWVVRLCGWLSRCPDVIVAVSEAGKKLHEGWGFDSSRMIIIRNGIDLGIFKPNPEARLSVRRELGVSDDTLLVGLMARLDPTKDHGTFFKAASLVSRRREGVHFLLAGGGVSPENPALARMVRENSLDGCVHLLGLRRDVPRLTAALDVACLASWSESFPMVVGEAMACGVPCVVTDVGDAALIVGDTGKVVPPKNAEALAAALADMAKLSLAERQALGAKARRRIQENFALAGMVHAFESLYERVHDGQEFKAMNGVRA